MPIRVFLVDDHEVARRGLRSLLDEEADIEVVGEAGTVTEGIAGICASRPDVAVVDLRLPDGSGVELVREVRARLDGTACVLLTSYPDDEALQSAVLAGAAGYVLKQVKGMDLLASVRRAAAGATLFDDAVQQRVVARTKRLGDLDFLTAQERSTLLLVAEGLTNRQIAAAMHYSEKTVEVYLSRVYAKTGCGSRVKLVQALASGALELAS